uniref:phosphodiesterase n=1 Tax=Halomonas sp. TaxID=1486246 RepID=UPI003458BA1A
MIRLVQISDCHLYADPSKPSRRGVPARQLSAVVDTVLHDRPDMVLVTGDLSQDESEGSYRLAMDTLQRFQCPWYWIPGNHDDLALMVEHREVEIDIEAAAWRIVQLNTRIEGEVQGRVGEEQLAALSELLADDERPTVIVMHHPPVQVGSVWIDDLGLVDQQAFQEVVGAFPQVKVVLCGHVHQAFHGKINTQHGDIDVFACPSTSDQFLAGSVEFAVDEASRPGYRVLDLSRDGSWQTWVERVEI